ncbi:hypothetical protein [Lachnoclostridium sp. Marseille-P6806]|uniref:hypothetical protein n=1 Tax=Lachnoclostridium sp. Marseille-P6806 TaxID=2364793 RepID=UPI001031867C|nr:hypothetical protein [Lachnoclostridium sp. Marseille-P6806]
MSEALTGAIDPHELFGFSHYEYGEAYFGSAGNVRFRLAREPLENVHYIPPDKRGEGCFLATVWPEPYGYAATDEAAKKSEKFEFSEKGLEAAVRWLNEQV